MIPFQFSPVAPRNNVKKDIEKCLKLACTVKESPKETVAKNCTKKMLKTSKIKNRTNIMFKIDGSELIRVRIRPRSLRIPLKIRNTRKTRNVRITWNNAAEFEPAI